MSAQPVNEVEIQSSDKPLRKIGYSYKEAQRITGLGRTTLWQAVGDGRLKCFKVGRRTLFSAKHLRDFMKLYEK